MLEVTSLVVVLGKAVRIALARVQLELVVADAWERETAEMVLRLPADESGCRLTDAFSIPTRHVVVAQPMRRRCRTR